MARESRFTLWAVAGLLIAGLLLALLMITDGARAPSVPEQQPASTEEPIPAAPAAPPQSAPDPGAEAEAEAEPIAPPELIATADELQIEYEARKDELPAEISQPIDEEVGVIEGALGDLMVAIAAEPNNDSLKRMLIATYRNEVKLLKKALHLTKATADDEPATESEE